MRLVPGSSFVLPWYRFAELHAIDPAERGLLVEDAAERATTDFGVLVGWALTLGALALAAVFYGGTLRQWHPAWLLPAILLTFIPLFLYRRRVVRGWVLKLVAERVKPAAPSHGPRA